jgi:hypothetical protein
MPAAWSVGRAGLRPNALVGLVLVALLVALLEASSYQNILLIFCYVNHRIIFCFQLKVCDVHHES